MGRWEFGRRLCDEATLDGWIYEVQIFAIGMPRRTMVACLVTFARKSEAKALRICAHGFGTKPFLYFFEGQEFMIFDIGTFECASNPDRQIRQPLRS